MAQTRMSWRGRLLAALFVGAMGFGTVQAFATTTDIPGRDLRNYCYDVMPCMAACGEAGGIYYGLMPNGGPLCDCCADPE